MSIIRLSVLFIVLFITISFAQKVHASHVIAADLTHTFISKDTIILRVKAYRDCQGISMAPTSIAIWKKAGTAVSVGGNLSSGKDVTPTCKSQCSSCKNSTCTLKFGIEEYTIEAVVNISSYSGCIIKYFWMQCCRPAKITTGGSGADFYIESAFDKCSKPLEDISFSNKPLMLVCKNQCVSSYQSLAQKNMSDSFSYYLTAPLQDTTLSIKYSSGFSYDKPLKYKAATNSDPCSDFILHDSTGLLKFTSTQEDITVIAVKVQRWSKDSTGVYKRSGFVTRDMMVSIIDCGSNDVPVFAGINKTKSFKFFAEANETHTFAVKATDADGDSIFISYNNDVPKLTFKNAGYGDPELDTFTFKPDTTLINKKPYRTIITAKDDNCPFPAWSQQEVKLFVIKPWDNVKFNYVDSGCGRIYVGITTDTARIAKYEWYINDELVSDKAEFLYQATKNGKHNLKLKLTSKISGNSKYFKSDYTVSGAPVVNIINELGRCSDDSLKLRVSGGKKYKWFPLYKISNDTIAEPYVSPDKDTTYYVTVTDSMGCSLTEKVKVTVSNFSLKVSNDTTVCKNYWGKISLKFDAPAGRQFNWSTGGIVFDSTNKEIRVQPLETTTYTLKIANKFGCEKIRNITVHVNDIKADAGKDVEICYGDSIQLTGNGGPIYIWSAAPGLIKRYVAKPWVKPAATQFYVLTVKDSIGCVSEPDTVLVKVKRFSSSTIKNISVCNNDTAELNVTGGHLYSWYPLYNILGANKHNPKVYPTKNTTYYVTTTDTLLNCKNTDSVVVTVKKLNTKISKSTAICAKDSIKLFISGGHKYQWFPDYNIINSTSDNPVAYPKISTTYYVLTTDTLLKCSVLDSVNVKVNTLTTSISAGTTICNGDSAQVKVTGGHKYNWYPGMNISNAAVSNPKVYPSKTTTYYVTTTDTIYGCRNTDSVKITVLQDCVWPGDANIDLTADYIDVLYMAVGYNSTGTSRTNATTDWHPQQSADWSLSTNGINYKYLDADGNGNIETADTLAVAKNYGKSHSKEVEPQLSGNPNDPPLYIRFDKKKYLAGDTVKASFNIGNSSKPLTNVLGVALKYFYNSTYMVPGSFKFSWSCDFLCKDSLQMQLYRQYNDRSGGEGTLANIKNVSNGYGKIADIQFVLKDSNYGYPVNGVKLKIDFANCKVLNAAGQELNVYVTGDSVDVYRTKNLAAKEIVNTGEIKIYPNPAVNKLYIQSTKQFMDEVYMVNILGELVVKQKPNSTSTEIETANMAAGIYFITVRSANEFYIQKIVVAK